MRESAGALLSNGFGRRLRFLVWDNHNGKLIGIIAIGDPGANGGGGTVFKITPSGALSSFFIDCNLTSGSLRG